MCGANAVAQGGYTLVSPRLSSLPSAFKCGLLRLGGCSRKAAEWCYRQGCHTQVTRMQAIQQGSGVHPLLTLGRIMKCAGKLTPAIGSPTRAATSMYTSDKLHTTGTRRSHGAICDKVVQGPAVSMLSKPGHEQHKQFDVPGYAFAAKDPPTSPHQARLARQLGQPGRPINKLSAAAGDCC